MGFEKVTIAATIAAAPATVWRAWTEPAHITQWNFAAPDWWYLAVEAQPSPAFVAWFDAQLERLVAG